MNQPEQEWWENEKYWNEVYVYDLGDGEVAKEYNIPLILSKQQELVVEKVKEIVEEEKRIGWEAGLDWCPIRQRGYKKISDRILSRLSSLIKEMK